MAQEFEKDPDAVLDYTIDWSDWLDDDTISTSAWATPARADEDDDITIDDDSNTTTIATVWLSGGTPGLHYKVTNHIVTADGREEDRTITIKVKQR